MLTINLHPSHCTNPCRPRMVAAGVDTLHLWTAAKLDDGQRNRLEGLQAAAIQANAPQPVELGGADLRVSPRWRRTVLAESDFYAVKIETGTKAVDATVSVEIRALALWSLGWREAAERARAIMRACCAGELDVQVTRCDVCVDFQGWIPSVEERHRFVSRSKARGSFWAGEAAARWGDAGWLDSEIERVKELAAKLSASSRAERLEALRTILRPAEPHREAAYFQAKRFTGFAFGRGRISARLYDKTAEIVSSRKGWFRAVWRKRGLDEEAPVWRLEFQLRREALREFETSDEGGTLDVATWDALSGQLDQLWTHLTSRWLRHGTRTASTRHVLSRQWAELHRAAAQVCEVGVEARPELHRVALKGALESVIPALAGYVGTAMAQAAEVAVDEGAPVPPGSYSALIAEVLQRADAYAAQRGVPLERKCDDARERIAARRRHVAGRFVPKDKRERLEAARRLAAAGRARATVWRDVDGPAAGWKGACGNDTVRRYLVTSEGPPEPVHTTVPLSQCPDCGEWLRDFATGQPHSITVGPGGVRRDCRGRVVNAPAPARVQGA